jgi:uncharacterized membrane protein YqjE
MSSRTPILNQPDRRISEDKTFGELLGQLATDSATLVRNELTLASKELGQKATVGGKAVSVALVAAFLGLASIVFLGIAAMEAIATVQPRWVAALIVAAALLIITGIAALAAGSRLKKLSISPAQTIETLKEDSEWLKKQV